MQRYFVEAAQLEIGALVYFDKNQSHHMSRVMRMNDGEQVIVVAQNKEAFIAAVKIEEDSVVGEVVEALEDSSELPFHVDIVCGLPKGDKLEHITQKATELGVSGIYPWASERSIVKWIGKKADKKIERLQKIASEASEQSHRNAEVEVHEQLTTKELLALCKTYDKVLVAYEESARAGEQSKLAETFENLEPGERVLMIFGPEGGLSKAEVEAFVNEGGAETVGLGKRILRTETAPLFALSALVYATELR